MKIVIIDANSTMIPHMGVMIDEAIAASKEGHEITYITCGAYLDNCYGSPLKNNLCCQVCIKGYSRNLAPLESDTFRHKVLANYHTAEIDADITEFDYEFSSTEQLKEKFFNGTDVGYAALSSFISNTRNMNPLMTGFTKKVLTTMLKTAVRMSRVCVEIEKAERPDKVIIFNGRMPETRPILRHFQKKGIPVDIMEVVPKDLNGGFRKFVFKNSLPHSIEYFRKQIDDLWDADPVKARERGESFFQNRRKAEFAGDKIYTKDQTPDLLPNSWNKEARNIVIFNSSEDEFAAIGAEWENKLFASQIEGIEYIFNLVDKYPNSNIYLRVHPNLKKIRYKYHTNLYGLKNHPRIHVIPSDSKVSTYAMVDAANVVVSFGTSVGVEAAYAHKPVVLLGSSFYKGLGFCHEPKTKTQAEDFIFTEELEPLVNENIVKYGNYIMSDKGMDYAHYNFNCKRIEILGRKTPNAYMEDQELAPFEKYLIVAMRAWRYLQRVILKWRIPEA
ncbi:capsular polysaccharide export protein, LipB/KpsS family [Bdellovibrio reynosensis]|uniref:Capsule biosynthesis protein n=1 Tax=Bdellovibrio reynosensis TaxID=2835041 RepID=A0ABY4CED8_9BACT|nr:hypothetical protein [Bdellovibrio reynosensis]UOF02252.1 hypothetical protein MNR06_04725 [Bdellovibrio reynosensis]